MIGSAANRQWVHVAMSRGRVTNTAYLTAPHLGSHKRKEQCSHVAHPLDDLTDRTEAALARIHAADTNQPPSNS